MSDYSDFSASVGQQIRKKSLIMSSSCNFLVSHYANITHKIDCAKLRVTLKSNVHSTNMQARLEV
jgi:hypothetical protein